MIEVEKWAKEISDYCEDAVGLIDKIILPYSSRQLRDKSVENILRRLAAEVLRDAAKRASENEYQFISDDGLLELAARYEEGRHER